MRFVVIYPLSYIRPIKKYLNLIIVLKVTYDIEKISVKMYNIVRPKKYNFTAANTLHYIFLSYNFNNLCIWGFPGEETDIFLSITFSLFSKSPSFNLTLKTKISLISLNVYIKEKKKRGNLILDWIVYFDSIQSLWAEYGEELFPMRETHEIQLITATIFHTNLQFHKFWVKRVSIQPKNQ